jgi:hypothetical protein
MLTAWDCVVLFAGSHRRTGEQKGAVPPPSPLLCPLLPSEPTHQNRPAPLPRPVAVPMPMPVPVLVPAFFAPRPATSHSAAHSSPTATPQQPYSNSTARVLLLRMPRAHVGGGWLLSIFASPGISASLSHSYPRRDAALGYTLSLSQATRARRDREKARESDESAVVSVTVCARRDDTKARLSRAVHSTRDIRGRRGRDRWRTGGAFFRACAGVRRPRFSRVIPFVCERDLRCLM